MLMIMYRCPGNVSNIYTYTTPQMFREYGLDTVCIFQPIADGSNSLRTTPIIGAVSFALYTLCFLWLTILNGVDKRIDRDCHQQNVLVKDALLARLKCVYKHSQLKLFLAWFERNLWDTLIKSYF